MSKFEATIEQVRGAINETAQSFHLSIEDKNGNPLSVPCTYQIDEPAFSPFRAAKGSPDVELQSELNKVVTESAKRRKALGIEKRWNQPVSYSFKKG